MSTKNKRQLRRSAPKRRRIGIGSLSVTEKNNDENNYNEDDMPLYTQQVQASNTQIYEDNDNDGWETAEAFNDDNDLDYSEAVDNEEEHDQDGEGHKYSGKKRRRQSKNGRESSHTELTLRDPPLKKKDQQKKEKKSKSKK